MAMYFVKRVQRGLIEQTTINFKQKLFDRQNFLGRNLDERDEAISFRN